MVTQFGTGLGTGDDSGAAARTAVTSAMDDLNADPDFCLVFCSSVYEYDAALAAIRSVVGPDTELLGCASTGEFTADATVDEGIAVSLVASDTIRFHTGLGTDLRENVRRAVRDALNEVPESVDGYPHRSAIHLHDGLQGVSERLALVSQRKLGPGVQFAGGAASDNFALESTPVFRGDTVAEDAVAIATMDAKRRPTVTVEHGHESITGPLEVTSVDGNVVAELDGRPAYEVWCDAVRDHAREMFDLDIDALAPASPEHRRMSAVFCFGIDQGRTYKIRWFQVQDREAGSLHFNVDIPEGTVLRVMRGTVDTQIASAREAARSAQNTMDGEFAGAFIYDCACRAVILDDEFDTAVGAIAEELDCPFVGFETYGEMCMEMGQTSGFHNTTTVMQLLPK